MIESTKWLAESWHRVDKTATPSQQQSFYFSSLIYECTFRKEMNKYSNYNPFIFHHLKKINKEILTLLQSFYFSSLIYIRVVCTLQKINE